MSKHKMIIVMYGHDGLEGREVGGELKNLFFLNIVLNNKTNQVLSVAMSQLRDKKRLKRLYQGWISLEL